MTAFDAPQEKSNDKVSPEMSACFGAEPREKEALEVSCLLLIRMERIFTFSGARYGL